MATKGVFRVECPHCGEGFDADFWTVVRGDQRGRSLGFPTANLAIPAEKLIPQRGVYAGAALLGEKWQPVALNIGFNPTFAGIRSLRVEAHLIGFDGDLYGKHLVVLFLDRLRGELQFSGVQELVIRMHQDTSEADSLWRKFSMSHETGLRKLAESLQTVSGD